MFIQSFLDAQDVTINFTQGGEYSRKINIYTAFFKVAFLGPEKFARTLKERPTATVLKALLWLTPMAIGS